jgi:hypothetical protein
MPATLYLGTTLFTHEPVALVRGYVVRALVRVVVVAVVAVHVRGTVQIRSSTFPMCNQ